MWLPESIGIGMGAGPTTATTRTYKAAAKVFSSSLDRVLDAQAKATLPTHIRTTGTDGVRIKGGGSRSVRRRHGRFPRVPQTAGPQGGRRRGAITGNAILVNDFWPERRYATLTIALLTVGSSSVP